MITGNNNTLRANAGVITNGHTTTTIDIRLGINADIFANDNLATKAFDIAVFTNKTVIGNLKHCAIFNDQTDMIANIDIVADLDFSTNIHATAFTEIAK